MYRGPLQRPSIFSDTGRRVPGDIITAVQGKQVDTISALLARLDDFKVGEAVSISIVRGGEQIQRIIQLQAE